MNIPTVIERELITFHKQNVIPLQTCCMFTCNSMCSAWVDQFLSNTWVWWIWSSRINKLAIENDKICHEVESNVLNSFKSMTVRKLICVSLFSLIFEISWGRKIIYLHLLTKFPPHLFPPTIRRHTWNRHSFISQNVMSCCSI